MSPANETVRPPLQISGIRFEPIIGDVVGDLERSWALIRQAAASGSRLVVLPELANTGCVFETMEEAQARAEPVPDGPSARAWGELARRLEIHIVAGVAERDTLFNSALVAGPNGYVGTWRKANLWDRETLSFAKGNLGFPVFVMPLGEIGVAICYDGGFPETFRQLALQGAEIV